MCKLHRNFAIVTSHIFLVLPYFPILRAKQGECKALRQLKPATKDLVNPVLYLSPSDVDKDGNSKKQPLEMVATYVRNIKNIQEVGSTVDYYLDPQPANYSATVLAALLKDLATHDVHPLPVLVLDNADTFWAAYQAQFGIPASLVIRVPAERLFLGTLVQDLKDFISKHSLEGIEKMILLDASDVSGVQVNAYAMALEAVMGRLTRAKIVNATFAFGSASYPEGLQTTEWIVKLVERKDLALWKHLHAEFPELFFADYATSPANTSGDFSSVTPTPKARYTLSTGLMVLRSNYLKRGPLGPRYERISSMIVGHAQYKGHGFSWGDGHIYNCHSLPEADHKRGGATEWVAVNTSHHIEHVVEMLAAM